LVHDIIGGAALTEEYTISTGEEGLLGAFGVDGAHKKDHPSVLRDDPSLSD